MDAEFIVASHAGVELLGIKIYSGKLETNIIDPMIMCLGNQVEIKQLKVKRVTQAWNTSKIV